MKKIKDNDIENLVASTMKNIENTYLSDKFLFALLLSKNNNYADEYLGKLNAKLKEQGIDRVITEMQSQINEWKANN